MKKISNFSEIGRLVSVMVRRPNLGLKLVTPSNLEEMLVEDVIDVPQVLNEHSDFVDFLLRQNINVVSQRKLIRQVLCSNDDKKEFLSMLFPEDAYARDFLFGAKKGDVMQYLDDGVPLLKSKLKQISPIVNNMFTRDPGVVIGNKFLIGSAKYEVRQREFSLTQALLKTHRDYAYIEHIPYDATYGTLEGGDVQVLSDKVIAIGVSERTSMKAVKALAPMLYKEGFEKVLAVKLEKKRSSMHLDTVFTMTSHTECILYAPMILGTHGGDAAKVAVFSSDGSDYSMNNLLDALHSVGMALEPILCGGSERLDQDREQWTDGANCLTIAPGHTITYNRNRKTIEEFQKHGYVYVQAKDQIEPLSPSTKYIVGLDGFELSRARGGSHCLSFPMERSPVSW